jgi:hypothetical protein
MQHRFDLPLSLVGCLRYSELERSGRHPSHHGYAFPCRRKDAGRRRKRAPLRQGRPGEQPVLTP